MGIRKMKTNYQICGYPVLRQIQNPIDVESCVRSLKSESLSSCHSFLRRGCIV